MLHSVNHLHGFAVVASDGDIGRVDELFFDDEHWAVRYLVVDTGSWLDGRKVLISPYSVARTDGPLRTVEVQLTRAQVENSPDIQAHQPPSRRHEADYLKYYGYPTYWGGAEMWGLGAYPLVAPPVAMPMPEPDVAALDREAEDHSEDSHLRSTKDVVGYAIQASDDSFGHVEDFLVDDASWAIRYLVIDTRNWVPASKRVLVATQWIDRVDWTDAQVHTRLSKEAIRSAPAYDQVASVDRSYEERLHTAHGRSGYWSL